MLSDAVHRAFEALDDWACTRLRETDLREHDQLVSALERAIRDTMVVKGSAPEARTEG